MNLVKWLRKNNKKVMAIVVIIILFMFIGGDALFQTMQNKRINRERATYGNGKPITDPDLAVANHELEILGLLRANFLISNQDLSGLFLSELLFSNERSSAGFQQRLGQLMQ